MVKERRKIMNFITVSDEERQIDLHPDNIDTIKKILNSGKIITVEGESSLLYSVIGEVSMDVTMRLLKSQKFGGGKYEILTLRKISEEEEEEREKIISCCN